MALRRLFGGQRGLVQVPERQLLYMAGPCVLSLPQRFPPFADIADSGRTASPESIAKLNDNLFTQTDGLLRNPLTLTMREPGGQITGILLGRYLAR